MERDSRVQHVEDMEDFRQETAARRLDALIKAMGVEIKPSWQNLLIEVVRPFAQSEKGRELALFLYARRENIVPAVQDEMDELLADLKAENPERGDQLRLEDPLRLALCKVVHLDRRAEWPQVVLESIKHLLDTYTPAEVLSDLMGLEGTSESIDVLRARIATRASMSKNVQSIVAAGSTLTNEEISTNLRGFIDTHGIEAGSFNDLLQYVCGVNTLAREIMPKPKTPAHSSILSHAEAMGVTIPGRPGYTG